MSRTLGFLSPPHNLTPKIYMLKRMKSLHSYMLKRKGGGVKNLDICGVKTSCGMGCFGCMDWSFNHMGLLFKLLF